MTADAPRRVSIPSLSPRGNDGGMLTFGEFSYYIAAFGLVGLLGVLGWLTLPELSGGRLIGFAMMSAALLMAVASFLDLNPRLRPASVLLVSLAICATPLVVVGLQQSTGLIPILDLSTFPGQYGTVGEWLSSPWLPVVVLTGIAALIAVVVYRYRFLVLILVGAGWALLTQVSPMLVSLLLETTSLPLDPLAGIGAFAAMENLLLFAFGIFLMFCGAWTDLATKREFAFWLYVTGAAFGWYFGHHMLPDIRHQLILAAMIYFVLPWFAAYLRRSILLVFAVAAGGTAVWLAGEILRPIALARFPEMTLGMWSGIVGGSIFLLMLFSWPASRFFVRLESKMNRRLPWVMEIFRPAPRKTD